MSQNFSKTLGLSATCLLLSVSQGQAAVTWNFNYTDAAGVGFNAAGQTGTDRRNAVQAASDKVSSYFTAYNATIDMDVNGGETNNNTLASAGSNSNAPLDAGFGNRGDVGIKILGGADPSAGADGTVNWNFEDFTWALGDTVPANEFDFKSTLIHELFHAVGFLSNIGQNGDDLSPDPAPQHWGPFDQFVGDSTGRLIEQSGNFDLDLARWNTASVGGTGTVPASAGLYFDGANANAANGGNPVPIYSPNPWEDGSSGSHLDDNYFNGTTADKQLMNSASLAGPSNRSLSAIELGILKDIGFTQVVPIPGAVWLMGSGLLALFGLRRRRVVANVVA